MKLLNNLLYSCKGRCRWYDLVLIWGIGAVVALLGGLYIWHFGIWVFGLDKPHPRAWLSPYLLVGFPILAFVYFLIRLNRAALLLTSVGGLILGILASMNFPVVCGILLLIGTRLLWLSLPENWVRELPEAPILMKQILKYGALALVAVALLFLALLVISPDFRGQAFSWIIISRHQTSHPISREKAAKYFKSGYFPTSAHDIQYAIAVCQISPVFESFLRFEAPVQNCLDHAKKQFSEIPLEPISKVFQPKATMDMNADWFDTGKIKHGLMGSKEGSCETIWIDTDRGIFYFHDTD